MTLAMQKLLKRLQRPADDGADLPGGTEDYGDAHTPTDDDAPAGDSAASGGDDDDAPSDAGEDEGALRAAGGDAEPEGAKGDVDPKTGTPKVGKGKFIPLDRHEKLLKKERARREELEAQLSQSQAGREVAKINDTMSSIEGELVKMEEQYNDLLAEGDTKGAAALMTQIRRKNSELNSVAAEHRDAEVMARAVEKVRYEEALERIEDQYPELVEGSDEFDADSYQDVVDLMRSGQQRGLSATKALQRAVARVMGAETAAQKRATTVTPRVDEGSVAEERRAAAVKRNMDAAKRTPPSLTRAGAQNSLGGALTAKAVMKMSEKEFEKLSQEDLAKLRGDTL